MNDFLKNIPTKQNILEALIRIEPYINKTPVFTCENINKITNCSIYFKSENFQKIGAFKSRGAINALFSLDNSMLINGVATHSSGNHAQALARAASLKNIESHIVMPNNSSLVKVNAVKQYGGNIYFCNPNVIDREKKLKEVIKKTNAIEIHPYNNYSIIAGQATATYEFIQQLDFAPEIIMAPVGGGGLLSGTALSSYYFSSNSIVIGAEPLNANDAFESFYANKLLPAKQDHTIADGLRTSLGSLTFPIIRKYVNSIITAREETIIFAMKLIWERMKIVIEPSSAVPLACILENSDIFRNKTVGIILSGGNVDLSNLPWQTI